MDNSQKVMPGRPLPLLVWMLSIVFLPYGVFIAYGFARLLSWTWSISLSALSAFSIFLFVQVESHLQEIHADPFTRYNANSAAMVMLMTWVYVLYRIGKRVGYWSPATLRGWRIAGWFAVAMIGYGVAATAFMFVLSRLMPSSAA
jgi:hypothetical protein